MQFCLHVSQCHIHTENAPLKGKAVLYARRLLSFGLFVPQGRGLRFNCQISAFADDQCTAFSRTRHRVCKRLASIHELGVYEEAASNAVRRFVAQNMSFW